MKFSEVAAIERRGYLYLCGFALVSCLSMAASNVFLGLAIAAALHRCVRQRPSFPCFREIVGRPVIAAFLVFAAVTVLSLVGALDLASGVRRVVNHYVFWSAMFFSVILFVRERGEVWRLAQLLALSVVLNDVFVIGQFVHAGGWVRRFGGGMFYMAFATAVLTALPLFLMYVLRGTQQRWRYAAAGAFLLTLVGLVLNGTRTVWGLALPFCLLAAYPCVEDKRRFAGGIVVALVAIGALFAAVPTVQMRAQTIVAMESEQSYQERMKIWTSAMHMSEDHPLGVGFGSFPKAYQDIYMLPEAKERGLAHAHNNIMEMLGECGVPGAVTFVVFWLVFSLQALARWRRSRELVHLVLFFAFNAIMMHGLTEFTWDRSITMKMFWMICGLAYAWIACGRAARLTASDADRL